MNFIKGICGDPGTNRSLVPIVCRTRWITFRLVDKSKILIIFLLLGAVATTKKVSFEFILLIERYASALNTLGKLNIS